MTPKMRKALDYIERYHRESGTTPKLDEIRAVLGLSGRSGAHRVVQQLIDAGHLVRTRSGARNLALPEHTGLAHVPTEALQAELQRRAGDTIRGVAERLHASAANRAEMARKGATHG